MELQGRELKLNMRGDDVKLLQKELRKLDLSIEDEEGHYGRTTRKAVLEFQDKHGLEATGVVDEETARRINVEVDALQPEHFVVKGEVRQVDGTPYVGGLIRAFDKDMRSEEVLGEVNTDETGHYEIRYTAERFRRAEKKTADLRVCACAEDGRELVSSPIIFNAEPVEIVDLTIGREGYRGPSEYERYVAELTPLLQEIPFAELREDGGDDEGDKIKDITFLTGETGINPERIAFLVLAHRLSSKTGLPPEVFYGFFRRNLPTSLPALLAQHPQVLSRALETALRDNVIPARLSSNIDSILEHLKELIVEHTFEEPAEEGRTSLSALLGISLPSRERQKAFLASYVRHEGSIKDFWKGLRESPEFNGDVDKLQFTLQLGTLTRNHLPLVKELQRMKQGGAINSLKDLARLDSDGWLEILDRQADGHAIGFPPGIPGGDEAEKKRNYIKAMSRIIEEAFPTAVIADRVGRDNIPGKDNLMKFFSSNPDFEFNSARIDSYLSQNAERLEGISDKEGLTNRLKSMQRIYKLTPRYDEMRVLLADNLHSARSIARMGKTAFIAKYSEKLGGQTKARGIYEKARHAAAMALTVFGKYGSVFHSTNVTPGYMDPSHIPDISHPEIGEAAKAIIEAIPNWTTLFGSPVLCECEHCRSAYSPAAYLVDILWAFLKDVPSAQGILFSRRPDIGYIELSCENTNTPVPYVDLVNEVLENAVSPLPPAFDIGPGFESELDNKTISQGLKQEFVNNGVPLSDNATAKIDATGNRWTITDEGWRYSIVKAENLLEVSTVPQTRGTPEEVSANPEYINENAYQVLAGEVYPWDLPFDLFVEEARTYLDHLGVSRNLLMETFYKGTPPSELTDIHIAAEYLGLTTVERDIITGAATQQPWEFWGLDENNNNIPDPADPTDGSKNIQGNWITVLSRMHVFLQRSGIGYKELLELLTTKFINPNQTLYITTHSSVSEEEKDTCDPSKLIIDSLDQAEPLSQMTLNRMHRFLRLLRKLGWKMQELDKAITALKPAELNDNFLLQLSHIQRLRAELKRIPVINMLSWWALVDTANYDDGTKSLYEQLFLNKAVMNPLDDAFNLDKLAAGTETISGHIPALLAALGINEADLSLLTKDGVVQATLNLTESEIKDDVLNLANLSHLYRIVSLAKALKLSVRDFLLVKMLSGINPFDTNHTEDTMRFVLKAQKIRESGFKVSELDYLLRHWLVTPSAGVAPTEESIALVLDEIRSGLQKINEETAVVPDPAGGLTGKNLTLLKWDKAHIERAVATLNGSTIYQEPLDTLPSGFVFPPEIKNKASYDSGAKRLRFTGAMTLGEKAILLNESSDPDYQSAINKLFEAPRTYVSEKMKAFEWPPFSAPLSVLPSGAVFPNELKGKIYYDITDKQLRFVGLMTEAEKTSLLSLSGDSAYQSAISMLFDAPGNYVPEEKNRFLTSSDASQLFDPPDTTAEQRFNLVLTKLLSYLRNSLSESLVKQKLGEAWKLEAKAMAQLLTQWVNSPTHPAQKSITEFLAADFVESNPNVRLTADSFPNQFKTFTLLHKIAMLILKFKVTPGQLTWLFEYGPGVGWLNLNSLPLDPANSASALFTGWERLVDLFQLRDQLPLGEETLSEIFALAQDAQTTEAALSQKLSERTGWKEEDLLLLVGAQGFGFTFPDDYKDEKALRRLRACFAIMKRLGVAAEQCSRWSKADLTADDARSIKQAVKAKYDNDQWLTVAKPLRDVLREKQRSALVSYLVANPQLVGKNYLGDSDALYEHFLIDIEMDPCMMTSRTKQAISSVQLFVQRCLMNLEEGISVPLELARQWKWMKNYRVWEANRKVFLYPENWIEPELRDNKSPFFKDLENQLLQNEVTMDTAEDAFLNYLENLNEVARLEIVGMYHHLEYPYYFKHPWHTGTKISKLKPIVDILHVFGRTRGTPHIYYYRQWVNSSYWTPWEKVDVDIEGNHLIPVVWNRRLHIFWPIFKEKAKEATQEEKEAGADPVKYWEIQIAWSEYKNGKWSAKKVSPQLYALGEPYFRPKHSFYFRILGAQSLLRIGVFLRKSEELEEEGKTEQDFNWQWAEFIFTGCDWNIHKNEVDFNVNTVSPVGTYWENMMFALDDAQGLRLQLQTGNFPYTESASAVRAARNVIPTLNNIPNASNGTTNIFRLLHAHQDLHFTSNRPFFYQDDTSTFFVIPGEEKVYPSFAFKPDSIGLNLVDKFDGYFTSDQPIDPIGPVTEPVDPQIFEESFLEETMNIGAGTRTNLMPLNPDGAPNAPLAMRSGFQYSGDISYLLSESYMKQFYHAFPLYQTERRFLFETFYHPYVCELIRQLKRDGIDGLLQRPNQLLSNKFFKTDYAPTDVVIKGNKESLYPKEDVDFSHGGAYSLYNWELFFHVPLLIADRLSKNQRFEEAQRWLHYIFDPTDRSKYDVPQRFWKVQPFFENSDAKKRIQDLLKLLAKSVDDPTLKEDPDVKNLVKQVDEWRDHPFNPHLIARLRITSYQKTVVMKYLDNLIAWGDQLFRRDTIESINEATQLYILAAQILGKRPEKVPPRGNVPIKTYKQLEPDLDAFSNALVQIENLETDSSDESVSSSGEETPLPLIDTLYFCLPKNDKLLEYWDTVADRLFKIRHCMTIEGVVRQLPLFEPPIDPALLVKAFAMGVDISSILNDMNAPQPHYRFNAMVQKAAELCNDVKALGAALLSALEKRDAEELALLRSSHEIKLLNAIRQIKDKQIEEAKETLESLNKSKEVTQIREQYYSSRKFMNPAEIAHMTLKVSAGVVQAIGQGSKLAAVPLALMPGIFAGGAGSMGSPLQFQNVWDGGKVAYSTATFGDVMMLISSVLSLAAETTATMASYERRKDDWDFQAESAAKELEQIDKQIAAADIRVAIAEQELNTHDLQVENVKEADEYMRNKFTNRELYDWMVSQVAAAYFQSYQLAYDIAKRVERAYRFELGLEDSNFIQFGYWDSLKKGLLAGEKLHYDLRRMEVAYLEQNRREYEITKHVSLAMLDPIALVKLKETGQCFVNLPEAIFDLDYPGHYMRRIKSVSLTIPCVTGPYTSVNCTLTLLSNSLRIKTAPAGNEGSYKRDENGNDPRFRDNIGAIQSIATSNAQNDSGVFELNFRDERYLPFEGAGAVSSWRLELPKDFRQFDYDTISDVIFHINYTAREGGGVLKQAAVSALKDSINEMMTLAESRVGLFRIFSARHEFSSHWHKFLHPTDTATATGQTLQLALTSERFPFLSKGKTIDINGVELLMKLKDGFESSDGAGIQFALTHPSGTVSLELNPSDAFGGLLHSGQELTSSQGVWSLKVTNIPAGLTSEDDPDRLNPDAIEDIFVVCHYSVSG